MTQSEVESHMKTSHLKDLQCVFCTHKFRCVDHLIEHRKRMHLEDIKHQNEALESSLNEVVVEEEPFEMLACNQVEVVIEEPEKACCFICNKQEPGGEELFSHVLHEHLSQLESSYSECQKCDKIRKEGSSSTDLVQHILECVLKTSTEPSNLSSFLVFKSSLDLDYCDTIFKEFGLQQ